MRRIYTSTAHFRAPYDTPNVSFAGLGVDHRAYDANRWPPGRSYFDVSQYRMPLRAGYYQSGALRGTDTARTAGMIVVFALSVAAAMFFDKLARQKV